MSAARAVLESALRARKLDGTLTSVRPWADADEAAATGNPRIDGLLRGGIRRGHLSEIIGPRSSGRTAVLHRLLAEATSRGEVVALIDTCDRFDPVSAAGNGLDLSSLLWIRDTGEAPRALKAMNLVLQAGGFGVVAFDLADVPLITLRQFPYTTWMRISRVIEGSQTAAVLIGSEHIARSPGGVTIALDTGPHTVSWSGADDRARHLNPLAPLILDPRIVSAR